MIAFVAALAMMQKAPPAPGDRISAFALQDSVGNVSGWKPGRPTVITFCAFWCDTWKEQTKRLRSASQSMRALPVDMLGISVDGRWSELGLQRAGMRFLRDSGGKWTASQGVDRVPYTMIVDKDGVVRWAGSGIVRSSDVVSAARSTLQESATQGTVYLTFDDFPSLRGDDDALLDILAKEDVQATFFCIGSRVAERSAIMRRAASEGHAFGVHAWTHDAANPQIGKCQDVIRKVTGGQTFLYRAPGHESIVGPDGSIDLKVVDPYDYQRPGANEISRRVLTRLQPNSVIQLHSGVSDTMAALQQIIAQTKKRGLTFGTLPSSKTTRE